jgi:hypothetical protein
LSRPPARLAASAGDALKPPQQKRVSAMNNTTPSPVMTVPEGFVGELDPVIPDEPASLFLGPGEIGDEWRIETSFTFEDGVAFELVPVGRTELTASQAIAAGNALARLGAKYA